MTWQVEAGAREKAVREAATTNEKNLYPIVKELAPNKCPAIAPLGVLEQNDGWKKIGLNSETVQNNLKSLLAHPDLAEKIRTDLENRPEFPKSPDPESALYDGFLDNRDRTKTEVIHNSDAKKLADFTPDFLDERLPDLLVHYKARNFPKSLTDDEQAKWEAYRTNRIAASTPAYLEALTELTKTKADAYLLEELRLWLETVSAYDY
jgi:exodeoxyribonuclease-1